MIKKSSALVCGKEFPCFNSGYKQLVISKIMLKNIWIIDFFDFIFARQIRTKDLYNTMILIYNTYKMNFKTNSSKAKSLDAISGLEWINISVHHYRHRIICIIVFVMKHLLSGAFFMPLGFCHLPFATKAQRHKEYKLRALVP